MRHLHKTLMVMALHMAVNAAGEAKSAFPIQRHRYMEDHMARRHRPNQKPYGKQARRKTRR